MAAIGAIIHQHHQSIIQRFGAEWCHHSVIGALLVIVGAENLRASLLMQLQWLQAQATKMFAPRFNAGTVDKRLFSHMQSNCQQTDRNNFRSGTDKGCCICEKENGVGANKNGVIPSPPNETKSHPQFKKQITPTRAHLHAQTRNHRRKTHKAHPRAIHKQISEN